MRTHVSDAELMDVVEGVAREGTLGHVEACRECRGRVEEAKAGLSLAAMADLPEPSPLFWEAQQRRVRERIDAVPVRRTWWPAAVLATAAAAWVAVVVVGPRPEAVVPSVSPALPAWSALPPAEDDPSYEVLEGLGAQMANAAPLASCLDWAGCVAGLSDEESEELASALRAELGSEKSL
jgi:hypothetical protein